MSKFNKDEALSKATKSLMLKEAFYGLFLMQLSKNWTDKINSAGIAKNGINVGLYINPEFWESLTDTWRLYVLKHQVLTVVFHHIELALSLPDKNIAVLASNVVCNQYIDPTWMPLFDVKYKDFVALNKELLDLLQSDFRAKRLTKEDLVEELKKIPPRGVYLEDFPELKLEPKQSLKYYYDKFTQAKNKQPGKGGSQALNDYLDQMEAEMPMVWDKDISDFEGISENEMKMIQSQTDFQLKEVAEQVKKSRGTVPGELAGYLESLDKKDPPKFNWKAYLRRFIGGSQKVDILRTRSKPNLRFPHNPGRRIRPRAHVLVICDTSGSVSDSELKEFFHEIYHIQKMGTDITVVQFDSAISNIQKYKKGLEDQIKIFGRGGTDFEAPCNYFNEHIRDFSCMIAFTDGEAPAPSFKVMGPCLWVHSTKSSINESLPGFKIKLDI